MLTAGPNSLKCAEKCDKVW